MGSDSSDNTFELGLVLAGAISAGAYSAGVVDFLIQALDAWEAEKAKPSARVPRHNVSIRVISGASAGAMTAALAAVSLSSDIDPVADPDRPPEPERNRLYDAWVRQIDITRLLTTDDLIGESVKVRSLLNAIPLERIASAALETPGLAQRRAYVSDPLALMLTVANLRGVPYQFALPGSSPVRNYGMFEHMDHARFCLSETGRNLEGARLLAPPSRSSDQAWIELISAALASGAFPVGLAAKTITRPSQDYKGRHGSGPAWPGSLKDYSFLCVDGGLMNNEPLELAREYLAGGSGKRNPTHGEIAHRAVVLIDPFPNEASLAEPYEPDGSLVSLVLSMFSALKNQARFKPEELQLALQPDVFSRFMISPSRNDASGHPVEPAIVSSIMDGFGGFLHEAFRRHDFHLGRRNCQAFLRWRFCVPATNGVVAGTDPEVLREFYIEERNGSVQKFSRADGSTVAYVPIIPLVGSAAEEVPEPPVPSGTVVPVEQLDGLVFTRIDTVGRAAIRTELTKALGRPAAILAEKAWSWHYARKAADAAMRAINDQLERVR